MPKKRKTRKEKILTDQKKPIVQGVESTTTPRNAMNVPSSQAKQKTDIQNGPTFSLPTSYIAKHEQQKTTVSSRTVVISTNEYTYLAKDLRKTALLTGAIFIIEILLRFFYLH